MILLFLCTHIIILNTNDKMKRKILPFMLLASVATYSQVGINTETPKATLDVTAKPTDLTKPDGFIAPRLKGSELKAKDALYITDQTGTIVYVTEELLPADTTTKTVNVTSVGYYYFDGEVWQTLKGTGPWKVSGTTNDATSNTQNIYQIGKVGIGVNPGDAPIANLQVQEYNSSGETGTSYGVYNYLFSNKQGSKFGIQNGVYDNSSAGAGTLYGINSSVTDVSTATRGGYGGVFDYTISGSKNNGTSTHVHGLQNNITLNASGGNLTTAYSYANVANASGNAINGNLTITGALRGYSGYALPSASTGYTFTATGDDVMGGHFTARPSANGGTINIARIVGTSNQFEPRGSGGSINITDFAAALRSLTSFSDNSTKTINNLYGLRIQKVQSGGAVSIANSYGVYIQNYRFTGDTEANAYNLYSEGANTKNYFQGKVGIGAGANTPASNLKVTGLQNLADNAAAISAGLAVGDFYHTNGVVKVVY